MKDRLRRNLWLKLVSLVLAYLAWTVVVGRPLLQEEISVTVYFKTADNAIVVEYEPSSVMATISGDETIFRSRQFERLAADLDLSGRSFGEHEVYVDRADLRNLPRGAEVERIDGPVRVVIEERSAIPIDVRVIQAGSIPETHRLAELTAVPGQVMVSGPASIVRSLDVARTEPVDLSSRRNSFAREIRIQQVDQSVTFEPDTVRVTATIVERSATSSVEIPLEGAPEGWVIEPSRVSVSITAAESVLQRVLGAARARISAAELQPGADAPVEVTFPGLPGDVVSLVESAVPEPAVVKLEQPDSPR